MGPSEIRGFGRAISRLGPDATHRMRVRRHGWEHAKFTAAELFESG